MKCPRCDSENPPYARFCMGCGLLLENSRQAHMETDTSRGSEPTSGSARSRTADARRERPEILAARRAAHHAASGLRRTERRHHPDRRVGQRREPYLGESPAEPVRQARVEPGVWPSSPAPSDDGPPQPDRPSYLQPERRSRWPLLTASLLLLIAAAAAWVAFEPVPWPQTEQALRRAADFIGFQEDPQRREREQRMGTSLHELPYDGRAAREDGAAEEVPASPNPGPGNSSGGIVTPQQSGADAGNQAFQAGRAEAAPAMNNDAPAAEEQQAAPEPPPEVRAKPRTKSAVSSRAVRNKELDRLRSQAYLEGAQ